MPKILIVGGGYAGFYTAWRLERHLRRGEAEVVLVDPRASMTYQPFLPEVAAGSIEPRHTVVAHRRHLKRTRIVTARVTSVDPASRLATLTPEVGEPWQEAYDEIVVTAGSVSRTFPIPGVADTAIGMKNIEEAIAVRDRLIANFEHAALLPDSPRKRRLLNVTVVGGGFAGVETIAELRSLASYLIRRYPTISFEETSFDLVEAMGRIMPEVSEKSAKAVVGDLERRGINVRLNVSLASAVDGQIELADGSRYESDLLIWTAGVMAHPMVKEFGLPIEERGRVRASATLQVVTADGDVVPGAWSAGDVAAVPDLSGGGVGGYCVPNAQHAVRQAKRMANNIVAVLREETPREYHHKNAGAVAGLGLWHGVMQSGGFAMRGPLAWLAHRGYHGLAMPTWERKLRVFGDWFGGFFLRRDIVALPLADSRAAFEEYAVRPAETATAPAPKLPTKESAAQEA